MDFGISGKVALVCGGGRGIGRACAVGLASEGADVAILARTQAEVDETARQVSALGRRALAVAVDVTQAGPLEAALARVEQELGAPTLLVLAIAAYWQPRRFHVGTDAESEQLLKTDLLSTMSICRRLLPGMLRNREGRVVALSSMAAWAGMPGGTEYATGKAGLEGFIRGLALDYSSQGVTANVVSLGFVETERLGKRIGGDPEARERLVKATARKRLISPDEVSNVVSFLCSSKASAITGSVIDVTAGAHLNNQW
jgi:NAD(P)-dependent dehydrogenase (short-subunit alcohol dehydrogenase family)